MSKKGDKQKYKTEKKVVYKKVKKKRFKLKFHTVLLALFFIYIVGYGIYYILNKPISNIYISGNTFYSDWEIIKKAGIEDYPPAMLTSDKSIEEKLKQEITIKSAKVTKQLFTRVYIEIEENKPLFYNELTGKTIFADGTEDNEKYDTPVLINEMLEDIYSDFLAGMNKIEEDIFRKISEIKYDPDEVDSGRILFTMNDGNYVYVTMLKFDAINDYNIMAESFDNKKGVLFLNSGGYFKIIEN